MKFRTVFQIFVVRCVGLSLQVRLIYSDPFVCQYSLCRRFIVLSTGNIEWLYKVTGSVDIDFFTTQFWIKHHIMSFFPLSQNHKICALSEWLSCCLLKRRHWLFRSFIVAIKMRLPKKWPISRGRWLICGSFFHTTFVLLLPVSLAWWRAEPVRSHRHQCERPARSAMPGRVLSRQMKNWCRLVQGGVLGWPWYGISHLNVSSHGKSRITWTDLYLPAIPHQGHGAALQILRALIIVYFQLTIMK